MEFKGKVALVTGGAGGIGRATSLAFARRGARVVVVDREAAAGEETARLAREAGGDARFVQADVTRSSDVQGYVEAALDAYGAIACFHNNAGIEGRVAPTAEYEEAAFDAVMGVNAKGVFLGLRHVLPVMIRQGHGSVVNTASIAGLVGTAGMPAYVASKHAVIGLTKVAAGEVGPLGVRVNAVCPGPIATRMVRDVAKQVSPNNPESVEERYAASIPLRRYGTAEEVANLVLFLCSDLAGNGTGAQYVVDGGRTAAPAGVSQGSVG
jgi:NAD(P)-dependent dehydrogenase (short-subunit alcohol dehydrogenase family)